MAAAQTRSELRERLVRRLGGAAFYEDRELDDAINEGIWIVQLLSRFKQERVDVHGGALAGRKIYHTPDSLLLILRAEYEGKPLEKATLADAGAHGRAWLRDPARASRQPMLWGPIGVDRFFVSPAPWTGGGLLTLYGVSAIPELDSETDTFPLSQELSDMVLDYAVQPLKLKESPAAFKASAYSYQSLLKRARALGAWMQLKNPRFWIEEDAAG